MRNYLVIRLYGPLASWGEIAVGESRHTAAHPSRSALLGLLGAALGIERIDDEAQRALAVGYRFAVKMVVLGSPLRDYHTVQAPPQQRKTVYHTRRQELADRSKLGTVLSSREYRCDSVAVVAIEAIDNALATLAQLEAALRQPVYPLYLGRKSCTLAVPLAPQIVSCKTVREALDDTPQNVLADLLTWSDHHQGKGMQWPGKLDRNYLHPTPARYYWEAGMVPGMAATFETQRNDQPLSRQRWQFVPRIEYVTMEGAGA